MFLRKVYFIEKFLSLLKVSFVEKFVLSKNLFFRKKLFWSIFVKWSFFMFFWQEPMQIFTLKSNTLEFQRSDENQVSYCHFSSFKAPSITEPRTKCVGSEIPLIQRFLNNFWSSLNAEFHPQSKFQIEFHRFDKNWPFYRFFSIYIVHTYVGTKYLCTICVLSFRNNVRNFVQKLRYVLSYSLQKFSKTFRLEEMKVIIYLFINFLTMK